MRSFPESIMLVSDVIDVLGMEGRDGEHGKAGCGGRLAARDDGGPGADEGTSDLGDSRHSTFSGPSPGARDGRGRRRDRASEQAGAHPARLPFRDGCRHHRRFLAADGPPAPSPPTIKHATPFGLRLTARSASPRLSARRLRFATPACQQRFGLRPSFQPVVSVRAGKPGNPTLHRSGRFVR